MPWICEFVQIQTQICSIRMAQFVLKTARKHTSHVVARVIVKLNSLRFLSPIMAPGKNIIE